LKTFPKVVDFKSQKNIIEEFLSIFGKIRYIGAQMKAKRQD
jgi:hypothetical protein